MFQSLASSKYGFIFLNVIIVATLFFAVDDPLQFFLFAGGVVTISFFVRRAINQFLGE